MESIKSLYPGLLTSIVYFVGRDIYAAIIFHNFQALFGVMAGIINIEPDHKNPLAFPLLDKNLSGLPAVYIATMALDALKDDKPKSKTVYLCKFQIDRIVVVLLFLK